MDPWGLGTLVTLMDRLPRTSNLAAARAGDDELAEALAQLGDGDGPEAPKPSFTDWDAIAELLAAIYDRIGEVAAGMAGQPPSRIKPWPRPVPASAGVAKRGAADQHAKVIDMVARARAEGRVHPG